MRPLGKRGVLSCTSWNTRYPLRNYFLIISSTAFYWSLYGVKWFIEMGIFPTTCLPRLWTRRFASFRELQKNYQKLVRKYIRLRWKHMNHCLAFMCTFLSWDTSEVLIESVTACPLSVSKCPSDPQATVLTHSKPCSSHPVQSDGYFSSATTFLVLPMIVVASNYDRATM